jgi:hypothetical protein
LNREDREDRKENIFGSISCQANCEYRADLLVDECMLIENRTVNGIQRMIWRERYAWSLKKYLLCGLRGLCGLILSDSFFHKWQVGSDYSVKKMVTNSFESGTRPGPPTSIKTIAPRQE